jgi:hypothetical protein
MEAFKFAVPFMIIAMILFTACGSASSADGVKNMKTTLVEMKKNVDADDAVKAKKGADELEQSWSKFEDDVKKNNAPAYEMVETPLQTIQAGTKAAKLDKAVLNKAITDLNTALDTIK